MADLAGEKLAGEKYVLLTTYTRDGRAKPTPVWCAPFDDALAVWSVRTSWKVKRIRNSGYVRVQACDVRGKQTHGPAYEGGGELLDADDSARVASAVARKYGITGRIFVLASRLRRGREGTIGIRLDLERV